ncbi:phage gp6-like head-tail connector protein [Streptomyces gilvus]|uniref:phage gp6-like head-tail connector protein n=1 Tax=Streptomyces gilvus TaxID=2920937 RepID=UPI001F10838F|nr:phage gp6-like head-tail connector protein [Streptomyces sp. CME 23]MCH5677833.1 phage gp6-like head-tail connector protein [Streptomyces sp. CME 23]
MANEYGTLASLKEKLSIEADDTSRDALLTSALAAASRAIDGSTGRRFWLDASVTARVYRLHERVVCEEDGQLLKVDDIGDTTGMTVESASSTGGTYTSITGTYDTTPDNALADGYPITGLLRPNSIWGTSFTRIRVTALFGWPAVPDEITEAALIQATRLYKRKDSPEGIIGSAEWGVRNLSRRDPDVWALIEPYILPGFA